MKAIKLECAMQTYNGRASEREREKEYYFWGERAHIIFDGDGCAKIPHHMIKSTSKQPFGEK